MKKFHSLKHQQHLASVSSPAQLAINPYSISTWKRTVENEEHYSDRTVCTPKNEHDCAGNETEREAMLDQNKTPEILEPRKR